MATTKDNVHERRTRQILKEALDRLNNKLMDEEEQLLLLARIRRLRKSLAA